MLDPIRIQENVRHTINSGDLYGYVTISRDSIEVDLRVKNQDLLLVDANEEIAFTLDNDLYASCIVDEVTSMHGYSRSYSDSEVCVTIFNARQIFVRKIPEKQPLNLISSCEYYLNHLVGFLPYDGMMKAPTLKPPKPFSNMIKVDLRFGDNVGCILTTNDWTSISKINFRQERTFSVYVNFIEAVDLKTCDSIVNEVEFFLAACAGKFNRKRTLDLRVDGDQGVLIRTPFDDEFELVQRHIFPVSINSQEEREALASVADKFHIHWDVIQKSLSLIFAGFAANSDEVAFFCFIRAAESIYNPKKKDLNSLLGVSELYDEIIKANNKPKKPSECGSVNEKLNSDISHTQRLRLFSAGMKWHSSFVTIDPKKGSEARNAIAHGHEISEESTQSLGYYGNFYMMFALQCILLLCGVDRNGLIERLGDIRLDINRKSRK